ncbi:MAG: hypothetical protein ABI577_05645 [bacterium]
MPLAPGPVQRALNSPDDQATGSMHVGTDSNSTGETNMDYDRLAEEVWPRIRRKIRVERERERGLPS